MTEEHPGQHLGKYEVLEELGRGSVGTIYKGYDPELDCPVAIKVLSPQFAADPEFVKLFLRQAQATAQLKHPHLVAVLAAGQQGGRTWMGMEYLNGIALRELIRLQGPMVAGEAHVIIQHLASALDHIHRAGLIHGDVRSGNVIICPPGRTILTELGVVRTSWEGFVASSAFSAAIAPEQITGGELGPWTDLYALGVLAYEMLAGQAPYSSDTTAGLLSQVVHEPLPAIIPLRPDLPIEVEHVVGTILAKEAHARYSTGAAFAAALGVALQIPKAAPLEGPPAEAAPPEAAQPQPAPVVAGPPPAAPAESAAAAAPAPAAVTAAPPAPGEKAARAAAAPPLPTMRPPDPHMPPPWESVPIRATPPPQPRPAASEPAAKITPLNRNRTAPSTPADRIARLRVGPAHTAPPQEKQGVPTARRPPGWLWVLIGSEVLLLLVGVVLIVLLVAGVL